MPKAKKKAAAPAKKHMPVQHHVTSDVASLALIVALAAFLTAVIMSTLQYNEQNATQVQIKSLEETVQNLQNSLRSEKMKRANGDAMMEKKEDDAMMMEEKDGEAMMMEDES